MQQDWILPSAPCKRNVFSLFVVTLCCYRLRSTEILPLLWAISNISPKWRPWLFSDGMEIYSISFKPDPIPVPPVCHELYTDALCFSMCAVFFLADTNCLCHVPELGNSQSGQTNRTGWSQRPCLAAAQSCLPYEGHSEDVPDSKSRESDTRKCQCLI